MHLDRRWLPLSLGALLVTVPLLALFWAALWWSFYTGYGPPSGRPDHLLDLRLRLGLGSALCLVGPVAISLRQRTGRVAWVRAAVLALLVVTTAGFTWLAPKRRTSDIGRLCTRVLDETPEQRIPYMDLDEYMACYIARRQERFLDLGLVLLGAGLAGGAALSGLAPALAPRRADPTIRTEDRQAGGTFLVLVGAVMAVACPASALAVVITMWQPAPTGIVWQLPLLLGFPMSLVPLFLGSRLLAHGRGREPLRTLALTAAWFAHLVATITMVPLTGIAMLPHVSFPFYLSGACGLAWLGWVARPWAWPTRRNWEAAITIAVGWVGLILVVWALSEPW